jgi:hypothetical protein
MYQGNLEHLAVSHAVPARSQQVTAVLKFIKVHTVCSSLYVILEEFNTYKTTSKFYSFIL